jgi:OOP family OmpA-OmpF porin
MLLRNKFLMCVGQNYHKFALIRYIARYKMKAFNRSMHKGYLSLLIGLLFCLGINQNLYGQKKNNGSSVEFAFGSSNAVHPFTLGYRSPTFGLFHAELGYRQMLNELVGYKITAGYDKIGNATDGSSIEFSSNYIRFSFQGVVDMGQVLRFRDFTRRFTILVHGGPGFSNLWNDAGQSGSMLNLTAGIVPQLKLSDKFRVFADFTRVRHVYQQVTFDLQSSHSQLGFDGWIANISLGAAILF